MSENNVDNLKAELKEISDSIEFWPLEHIKEIEDKNVALALSNDHFQNIEEKLFVVLNQIQNLPEFQRKQFARDIQELKELVDHKYKQAENELNEAKSKVDHGKLHAKAIKAYSQI